MHGMPNEERRTKAEEEEKTEEGDARTGNEWVWASSGQGNLRGRF